MPGWLGKLLSGGASKLVDSVTNGLDNLITNKEELAAAKLAVDKEVNRHMEAIQADVTKQIEIEVQDRASARVREAEFVKATGHVDYLQWALAIGAIGLFGYSVYAVVTGIISKDFENLFHNILGIIEGVILSIYNYYFGSSAGSRIKDMKGKS